MQTSASRTIDDLREGPLEGAPISPQELYQDRNMWGDTNGRLVEHNEERTGKKWVRNRVGEGEGEILGLLMKCGGKG